jgi:hypothetical protein
MSMRGAVEKYFRSSKGRVCAMFAVLARVGNNRVSFHLVNNVGKTYCPNVCFEIPLLSSRAK